MLRDGVMSTSMDMDEGKEKTRFGDPEISREKEKKNGVGADGLFPVEIVRLKRSLSLFGSVGTGNR